MLYYHPAILLSWLNPSPSPYYDHPNVTDIGLENSDVNEKMYRSIGLFRDELFVIRVISFTVFSSKCQLHRPKWRYINPLLQWFPNCEPRLPWEPRPPPRGAANYSHF